MDALLDSLLSDLAERPLPRLTRREIAIPNLARKANAVVGMRRSGKTWFLFQQMQDLVDRGIGMDRILYVNFEDERLLPMRTSDLQRIPAAFFRRYPESFGKQCFFFFDEIQRVDGWESFVRRLVDEGNRSVAVTGSSGRLLSREIATQLRGRSLATEILPFSFREALDHQGIQRPPRRPGQRGQGVLGSAVEKYLACGGFPEVQGLPEELRLRILSGYVDVVVLRDVVERHEVANVVPLRYLIRHILSAPGRLFSVNRFHNDLRSQGIPIGKNTLHEYFDHLTDAYLFFPVHIHTRSERARMVNPRKVYPVDPGLVSAFARAPARDLGALLETAVYLHLRRSGRTVEYLVTSGGREVDFLAAGPTAPPLLVQSCVSLRQAETREREVRALSEAMGECRTREGTIVTLHESETLDVDTGTIRVVPAWWWLLQTDLGRSP